MSEAAVALRLVSLVPLMGAVLVGSPGVWFGAAAALFCAGVAVSRAAKRMGDAHWQPGGLEAVGDALWVTHGEARWSIPRAEVARAELIETPSPGRWALVLHTTTGELVHLALADHAAGEGFLRDAGLARTPAAERVRFVGPFRQAFNVLLLWGAMMAAAGPLLLGAAAAAFGLAGAVVGTLAACVAVGLLLEGTRRVVRAAWTPSLTVGAEGVQVHGMWSTRFVPYAQLSAVEVTPSPAGSFLRLPLVDGTSVGFSAAVPFAQEPERAAALLNVRLRGWRARNLSGAASLARSGRTVEAWREAVAQHLGGGGVFRSAAVGRDVLLDVLDGAAAPAPLRLGAALALSQSDEGARARVRIAAEASADATLREALEAALEGRLDEAMVARVERAAGGGGAE